MEDGRIGILRGGAPVGRAGPLEIALRLGELGDEQWEDWARATARTCYHPTSSCRMGVEAADSVVDPRLRVHGIQGLRVIDASIMPTITSGNTNTPTAMIALQGAKLIAAARQRA